MPQVQRADRGQDFDDNALDLRRRETEVEGAEGDISTDCGHEELVVRILEHHADRPTYTRERFTADQLIADAHAALPRGEVPVEVEQQRGLARTVPTHERNRFAVADAEGHPL